MKHLIQNHSAWDKVDHHADSQFTLTRSTRHTLDTTTLMPYFFISNKTRDDISQAIDSISHQRFIYIIFTKQYASIHLRMWWRHSFESSYIDRNTTREYRKHKVDMFLRFSEYVETDTLLLSRNLIFGKYWRIRFMIF